MVTTKPGEIKASVMTPQGLMETVTAQVEGDVAVIVQLRDDPILKFKGSLSGLGPEARAAALRQQHEKLKNAHAALKAWIKGREPGRRDGDFKDYHFAFNGVASLVDVKTFEKLKKHPDVVRVHRDGKVEKCRADSVPLIGAPTLWSTYGADGTGIRVAVIDTGIDYTHPDLGGAFGPGNKVIGGYDFINLDTDPKDDHGHGTHVAGIIAGNGAVKGVAPGASLLAYKVLDANGSGSFSTVIAGIDRAVDPDQDPTTNDAVNVISMSLGGGGDPDDAVSQAIDTAVGAGVVCVIAAGNSGSYSSILSPGCARKALTVGASDKSDVIADFSSRGPNKVDYSIKPDLTAPGVSITSTFLNGGYKTWSGTSMATPHVAGSAALLLQLHPNWTPDDVKGVLSERAKDLGNDAFTQGGGRVQIVPSHLAKAVMTPNSLNFGVDDTDQGVWQKTVTVQFKSLDTNTRTYSLSVQGSLPAGITWSLNPESLILQPGQTQTVALTLSVDNASVPFAPPPTMAYGAKLVATAQDDMLSVPAVFYKAGILKLTFDVEPCYIFIDDSNSDCNDGFCYVFSAYPGLSYSLMVPPRAYNVVSTFLGLRPTTATSGPFVFSRVVRENVDVKGITNLSISLDGEAVNQIILLRRDPFGNEIPYPWPQLTPAGSAVYFGYQGNNWGVWSLGWPSYIEYFSNVSPTYKFEEVAGIWTTDRNKKYIEFKHGLKDGIGQSDSIINSTPFKNLKLNFESLDPAFESIWLLFYVMQNTPTWAIGTSTTYCSDTSSVLTSRPFEIDAYLPTLPYPEFGWNATWPTVMAWKGTYPFCNGTGEENWQQILWGGLLGVPDANTVNVYEWLSPYVPYLVPFLSTTQPSLRMGESPHFWSGQLDFWDPGIYIHSAWGWVAPLFMSQVGDGSSVPLSYQLFKGSELFNSGTINNPGTSVIPFTRDSPGSYALKIPFDGYFVNGQRGHSLATMTFDTSRLLNPPHLKHMTILRNGQISSATDESSQNQLYLEVGDASAALAAVEVSYHTPGGWQWLPLAPPSSTSGTYLLALPPGLLEGPVNLKVLAKDRDGNALNYELTPAYYHFNAHPTVDGVAPNVTASESQNLKTLTLSATATDNVGIWQVAFYVDGILKGVSTTAPYAVTLDSTTLSDVSHTLVAKGYDLAGNVGASPSVPFIVDNLAPTATASESGSTGTITLSATAIDNVGVTKVEFFLDGALKGSDTTAPYSLSWATACADNGAHTVVAKAYDAAGNMGVSPGVPFSISNPVFEQEPNNTFSSANAVPSCAREILGKLETVSDVDYFLVSVTAGGTLQVDLTGPAQSCDLFLYGAAGDLLASATGPIATKSLVATNRTASLASYFIRINFSPRSYDSSPYALHVSGTSPVPDTTPPTVSASESGVRKTITLSATATDNVGVTKVEFHVDDVRMGTVATAPYKLSVDSTPLTDGPHDLVARAYDAAGNVGASARVPFRIDNTAPTVTASESGDRGTLTLSATAADQIGVTKVELYLDGLLQGSAVSSPYASNWTTTYEDNGPHALLAKAYDAAGNVGTSASVNFTVSNPVPETFTEQEPNDSLATANAVPSSTLKIVGTIGSSMDVDNFRLEVGGGRTLQVTLTGPAATCELYLYDSSGALLSSATGFGDPKSVSYTNPSPSTEAFYLRIRANSRTFDPASPYTLTLSR